MGHNYSGNHPRFSMAKPSPLKDSRREQHKHEMENAVNDLEKGDKVAGKFEAKKAEESSPHKNIGKALTPGAAMGHPGSSFKKGGEAMHASVSSAVKNVLGPDNPHTHGKGGKVEGKNAMKMKNDDDGGGILASDPGAAGRELLYNQSKASGVKKKKEHKGY